MPLFVSGINIKLEQFSTSELDKMVNDLVFIESIYEDLNGIHFCQGSTKIGENTFIYIDDEPYSRIYFVDGTINAYKP